MRRFVIPSVSCVLIYSAMVAAQNTSRPENIVDIKQVEPSIIVDMMYATNANFIGRKVAGYKSNICFLTKAAAEGLKNAQERLRVLGDKSQRRFSLLVKDCYRPRKAVLDFVSWANNENETSMKRIFYPYLSKSELMSRNYISPVSGHSRGSSVDLTIVEIKDNQIYPLDMGTTVDYFGEKSHTHFADLSPDEKKSRQLLKSVLSPEFKNYPKEWWHYVLAKEVDGATTYDFDIETVPPRTPQSVASNEMTTQLTSEKLMQELDQNNDSLLSLVNLFKRLHQDSKINIPTFDSKSRSTGTQLSLFSETYGQVSKQVQKDIARIISELGIDWEKDITKTYDVNAAKTSAGKNLRVNGNVTRIFNEKWLTSSVGQFLLAGIVNRIDRREFTRGTCGEVRFIYRLGYEHLMNSQVYASRVPFTLNMVYTYKDDNHNCRDMAALWNLQSAVNSDPAIIANRLMAGPIDFNKLVFKQMEINAQVARFPSDLENVENRKFAGQAIYLMRVFELKNGLFSPRKLENTPDVQAILKNPEMKKQLLDYISKNLRAIDLGVYQIPDNLLADVAVSYSTFGSSRLANKPFDLLVKSDDVQKLISASKEPLQFIANGHGLIERLNTSTCMGCHQSSSTAGFHLLGTDRADYGQKNNLVKTALDGNRLVLPFSPHLFAELPRRSQYLADLVNNETPNSFRPHPSAPPAQWTSSSQTYSEAGENMPCLLKTGSEIAQKGQWSCNSSRGLKCEPLVTNTSVSMNLGQCVPQEAKIYSGLSCRKNEIKNNTSVDLAKDFLSYNIRAFTDQVLKDELIYKLPEGKLAGTAYNCRPTKIGVPLGRVTKNCTPSQVALKDFSLEKTPDEMCAVVGGKGFEEMAKGYFSSAKFADGVGRGMLNTCSPTKFCREDYICQEMPDFLTNARFGVSPRVIANFREKNVGFCTPTYFVYQLRLDGHPNP